MTGDVKVCSLPASGVKDQKTDSRFVQVLQFTNSMSHDVIFTLPHSLVVSGEPGVGPAVNCVSWAPSCGRRYHLIATGGRDGKVKIWKISPPGENNRLTSEWVVNSAGTFDEHQ